MYDSENPFGFLPSYAVTDDEYLLTMTTSDEYLWRARSCFSSELRLDCRMQTHKGRAGQRAGYLQTEDSRTRRINWSADRRWKRDEHIFLQFK